MKKSILSTMLVVSLVLSTVIPKKSHALVGALVASPAVIVLGGVALIFIGGALSILRLIILNDNSHGLEFTELKQNQITEMGITPEQAAAFNSKLDEINTVKQSIEAEVDR